jgi:hypothetical protein
MMVRQRMIPKSGNRFSDKIMRKRSGNERQRQTWHATTKNQVLNILFGSMRDQRRRTLAGKTAQNRRSKKSISGQIAGCRGA